MQSERGPRWVCSAFMSHTWGYLGDGYYTVFLVDGKEAYRDAALKPLGHLQAHYSGMAWEPNDTPYGSADGYADAIEGALNLLNRAQEGAHVPSTHGWLDSQIRILWDKQGPDGIIEGWHGDGNFARTTLMYVLWKSQGVTFEPWREDVRLGAVRQGDAVVLSLGSDKPWTGRVRFDRPRHAENLQLPLDWPRINQFPEWFVVREGRSYTVADLHTGTRSTHPAAALREGLAVTLDGRRDARWRVAARP